MEKTFDHLLGLNARTALALLGSYGITDVRVTLTGAPPIQHKITPACPILPAKRISVMEGISQQFSTGDSEDDEQAAFDPLLDDELDDGMLVESRVVAVREDGRQLIVARFHVGEPKPGHCDTQA